MGNTKHKEASFWGLNTNQLSREKYSVLCPRMDKLSF